MEEECGVDIGVVGMEEEAWVNIVWKPTINDIFELSKTLINQSQSNQFKSKQSIVLNISPIILKPSPPKLITTLKRITLKVNTRKTITLSGAQSV